MRQSFFVVIWLIVVSTFLVLSLEAGSWLLVASLWVFGVSWLTNILHELAHAIAASLASAEVLEIKLRAGRPWKTFIVGGLRITIGKVWLFSGGFTRATFQDRTVHAGAIAALIGAPLALHLGLVILLWPFRFLGAKSGMPGGISFAILYNLYAFGVNAFPSNHREGMETLATDGKQLVRLFYSPKVFMEEYTQASITTALLFYIANKNYELAIRLGYKVVEEEKATDVHRVAPRCRATCRASFVRRSPGPVAMLSITARGTAEALQSRGAARCAWSRPLDSYTFS